MHDTTIMHLKTLHVKMVLSKNGRVAVLVQPTYPIELMFCAMRPTIVYVTCQLVKTAVSAVKLQADMQG